MTIDNLSVVLAERPIAEIIPGKTFAQRVNPAPTRCDLKDGEILVEALYLSLDPTMRGWIEDTRSYLPPVQIGEVMRGTSAARVLASKSERAKEGDIVASFGGWSEYSILSEDQFEPTSSFLGVQEPQDYLSTLGITSLTAWVGMTKIGKPKPGELVVVSGAAGATGSVAGQIAKICGARVVGIAGSDEKCQWLVKSLGFDHAINYKSKDFKDKFNKLTEKLIDVYFDNGKS
ncbi:hypothetical protein NW762_006124 [Fusarium torreyae]|uniref:NADP-dependent oxidoreductase n=1 Tax=Fusarium torreyae TaxID=1237075 RepID=A0A9W8S1F1_9HYPO|nr:hypothetical protein NW762_006124 [Fusarium torreyae]